VGQCVFDGHVEAVSYGTKRADWSMRILMTAANGGNHNVLVRGTG
jgi:hypothetical protein